MFWGEENTVVCFLLGFVLVPGMLAVFCFCSPSEEETSVQVTLHEFTYLKPLGAGGRGFVPVLIGKIISP